MRSRLITFLLIFVLVYIYLALELAIPLSQNLFFVLALAIPFIFIFLWVFHMVFNKNSAETHSKFILFAQWGAFISMGGLSILFFVVLGRSLLGLVYHDEILYSANATWLMLLMAGIFLAIGMIFALSGPRIRKVHMRIPSLKKDLHGLRIAQITDLHIGATIGKKYVQNVVEKINRLGVDMVVMTGDIADGPLHVYKEVMEVFRELEPRDRVYFCPGNHEYYWNGEQWISFMESLGLKALLNTNIKVRIGKSEISIAGVIDPAAKMMNQGDGPDLNLAYSGSESSDFKILLAHQPNIAERASAAGFDLQISGHTHGGQFFPWTLVVRKFQRYYKGLYQIGNMFLYVSPGTGSWGPPVRLGTRTEIALITLQP